MSSMKLFGKKIALTGLRKSEEVRMLLAKHGGTLIERPTQGTLVIDKEEIAEQLRKATQQTYDWFIFTTGIGLETLLEVARENDLEEAFVRQLSSAKIAARGYKVVAALKRIGLAPQVRDDDGTTAGLVRCLQASDFRGGRVALQLYGETAPKLTHFLQEQNAAVDEIFPYRNVPPATEALQLLISDILAGQIDAVMFTTAPQVRFLFEYAAETPHLAQLLNAFETGTLAVSVGKLTTECLQEAGVDRILIPTEERIGSMVVALTRYYES